MLSPSVDDGRAVLERRVVVAWWLSARSSRAKPDTPQNTPTFFYSVKRGEFRRTVTGGPVNDTRPRHLRPRWAADTALRGRHSDDHGRQDQNARQEAAGKVKEGAGKATGNKDMEAEGKGDQAVADVKQAGDKAKDAPGS